MTLLAGRTIPWSTPVMAPGRAKVISDKVKAALAEIVKRKTELSQTSQKRTQLQQ